MKTGLISDWTGGATHKIQIIDETISGKYVCRDMPIEMIRPWDGSTYLTDSVTSGIFLRDKKEVKIIKEGREE